eukprot:2017992-Rhodomonas_salina.1
MSANPKAARAFPHPRTMIEYCLTCRVPKPVVSAEARRYATEPDCEKREAQPAADDVRDDVPANPLPRCRELELLQVAPLLCCVVIPVVVPPPLLPRGRAHNLGAPPVMSVSVSCLASWGPAVRNPTQETICPGQFAPGCGFPLCISD